MSDLIATNALDHQNETIRIAAQWAQEKLENFTLDVENNPSGQKLVKISHIISRRSSIDIFSGQSSEIGEFATGIVKALAEGDGVLAKLSDVAVTVLKKVFGAASGSAQTEKIYEITFNEQGGLDRLDVFFFCYRFTSSGMTDKAVVGICIIRSAAEMDDDNRGAAGNWPTRGTRW
ncbi:hypothetical protein B0T10DRAFT_489821 [Thelonectria olida]|uniref:Uncharacterized protein n=1 Tax=Thelonectria olida TaxID=1576542 RepID=A0A9P9AKJ1_9HYPO|nr:hypothetical protein B0T10DRAFT_489821 [Thelonectria olida]